MNALRVSLRTKQAHAQISPLNINNQTKLFLLIHVLLSPKTVQEIFHTNYNKDSSKLHCMKRGFWEVWIAMLEGATHLEIPLSTPCRKHILCQKAFTMATLSWPACILALQQVTSMGKEKEWLH